MSGAAINHGASQISYNTMEMSPGDDHGFRLFAFSKKLLFTFINFSRSKLIQPISTLKLIFDGLSLAIGMIHICVI